MTPLFIQTIDGWTSWGKVFQSLEAFQPLISYIFHKEKLPMAAVENLTPGTNAVFKVGNTVIKIFAPKESGLDGLKDMDTELFATARANRLGVPSPTLLASGIVEDRYRFGYMATQFIEGVSFKQAGKDMTHVQKICYAQRLQEIVSVMDITCEKFNEIDAVMGQNRLESWESYSESFCMERLDYIKAQDYHNRIFVHGDLNADNLLITPEGRLVVIDFADSVLAPIEYEHASVASELFQFDKDFLQGYFGYYDVDELTELCIKGLLIHDFGGDIITRRICGRSRPETVAQLRTAIQKKLI